MLNPAKFGEHSTASTLQPRLGPAVPEAAPNAINLAAHHPLNLYPIFLWIRMTYSLHSSVMATNIVACVLGLLVLANALQFPRHATRISRELVSDTEYDFIVVGGGVSGLTVADRLTENPSSNHHHHYVLL